MLAYGLVSHSFDVDAVVLGGLLIAGALISELVNRSFVSLAAVFVVVGFILGDGGIGVLDFTRDSGFVADLGNGIKGWQSGYVRNYAFSMLVGVVVVGVPRAEPADAERGRGVVGRAQPR